MKKWIGWMALTLVLALAVVQTGQAAADTSKLEGQDIDFGTLMVGSTPAAQQVIVTNTGTGDPNRVDSAALGKGTTAFSYTPENFGVSIPMGDALSIGEILPDTSLAPGDYTATLTFVYTRLSEETVTINIHMTLVAAPEPEPPPRPDPPEENDPPPQRL